MNKLFYIKWKITFSNWLIKTLYEDNYLLLFKDNSFLVHTLWQVTHIYSCEIDKVIITEKSLDILSKKDWLIRVDILENYNEISLANLSTNKLEKSLEEDKKNYVLSKLETRLGMFLVSTEYQTETGRIDILATNKEKNTYYVLELKNREVKEKDINQCLRYLDDLSLLLWQNEIKWYVIWTWCSDKVKKYSQEKGVQSLIYNDL